MTAPPRPMHLADEQLDDYVDGLLESSAHDRARAHLAECAECASRLEELRTLLTLSTAERRAVEPPAELWPLVVASTLAWPQLRRRVLRSLRVPLAAAAIALVLLSVATTSWIVERLSTGSGGAPSITAYVNEDASLDRALAARDHEHGPVSRERIAELRAKLAAADGAIRRAADDEALYRALAERERVLAEIRPVLGRAPQRPRAPTPGQ